MPQPSEYCSLQHPGLVNFQRYPEGIYSDARGFKKRTHSSLLRQPKSDGEESPGAQGGQQEADNICGVVQGGPPNTLERSAIADTQSELIVRGNTLA
ncbi:unnamed protein product [Caenorhabditis nigoni]